MSIDRLKDAWNVLADKQNQWDELGVDEVVAFAQSQALEEAANKFEGAVAFNWVAADGYSNGFAIAAELRYMADKLK